MGITELAKTPGYIYGAGYCMGLFLYIHFRKKRFGMAVTFLFMMLAVLVIEGWMYVTRDIKTIYFMPCVCVTISIFRKYTLTFRDLKYNSVAVRQGRL